MKSLQITASIKMVMKHCYFVWLYFTEQILTRLSLGSQRIMEDFFLNQQTQFY